MKRFRLHINSITFIFALLFALASLGLLGITLWDQYQTRKAFQEAEIQWKKAEENTHALQAWVDENPRAEWEKDAAPKNSDGEEILPPPPPVDMAKLKTKGCVADGFLSGYGGDINSSIALINRSECYYLHRALETWLAAPDFELAREIKAEVTKPNTVYGMFIAEAISTNEDYFNPEKQRDFDFDEMCRKGARAMRVPALPVRRAASSCRTGPARRRAW